MPFSPTSTQYLVGTPNGVLDGFVRRRVRVANLAFDQTNSFFRLFVFCSFAPSPHGYTVSRGVP